MLWLLKNWKASFTDEHSSSGPPKAKEELIDLLKHHEAVLAFQEAEKAIGQVPQISHLGWTDEGLSTRSRTFSKSRNNVPMREAGEQADLIQHELENLPIVQDYRQKCRMPVTWSICDQVYRRKD